MYVNAFIVYALCDARTHQIRYIGCSEIGLVRPLNTKGYKNNPEVTDWLRDLRVCGSEHVILVLASPKDIAEMRAAERYWIDQGRRFGWPLLNRAGFTLDIEAVDTYTPPVDNKRRSLREWRRDPEVRSRLAAARESRRRPELQGNRSGLKGRPKKY
jgi:hypothetical protein